MVMKLTIEQKSTVEVEVNFPHYRKVGGQNWVVFNEEGLSIWVINYTDTTGIEKKKRGNFAFTFGEESNEAEFLKAYADAQSVLTLTFHEHFTNKNNPFINDQSDRAGEV